MAKYFKRVATLIFPIFALFSSLFVPTQTQVWQKRAEEGPLEASFEVAPQESIKRIWTNYAQGGEESVLMLKPAEKEIKKLQPEFIRIDHLFDFYEILKRDSQGSLVFDFSHLDQRVEEIKSLGATPFLSLSYFPRLISPDPSKFPDSLAEWQILIEKTIQRYSGKAEKNLAGVYYEVWNEPDLFGRMTPETYFSLYQSSVLASDNCRNCNAFKIGGPAITTLKVQSPWMDSFLNMVSQKQTRLDFISWHSYQIDPLKMTAEVEGLKNLSSYLRLATNPELIVSEWGSVPEVSPLHDSYFDASHTIAAVAAVKNSVDKLFAFELKDGPSPEKKQFWGRWGLLTHEGTGLTAKPRYFAFIYLNKLLQYRLNTLSLSPDTWAIGSTDGKAAFSFVISRTDKSTRGRPVKLKLIKPPAGSYKANIYSLDPSHNPLFSSPVEVSFSGGSLIVSFPSLHEGVYLVEIAVAKISQMLPAVPE